MNSIAQGDSGTEHFKGDSNMKRHFFPILVGLLSIAAIFALVETRAVTVNTASSTAVFDSNGRLQLPTGYRRWVFVGAPLTPNGLNDGKAGFPEYHHVYVEEKNLDVYLKTGSFPEGTVIVKRTDSRFESDFSRRLAHRTIGPRVFQRGI